MSAILKLEDLCYGYIDGGYKREILKHLSYSFEEGTFYTILGPSGSGKTTLLSIMGMKTSIRWDSTSTAETRSGWFFSPIT